MYIPLNIKSNYSLLSSMLTIDDIIDYFKNKNLPYAVLTDTTMYGVMEFIKKCNDNNLKSIIGLSLTLDKEELVLFAKDYEGYKSLIKLSTIVSEKEITIEELQKNNTSLIAIVSLNNYSKLSKIYNDIYIGYSSVKEEFLARKESKNLVFFKENLYLNSSDREYLKYLYLIRDGKTINDEFQYNIDNKELDFNNYLSFSSKDGLDITYEIAEKCNIVFPKPKLLLPIYKDTKDMDPKTYLFELCKAGLNKRLNGNVDKNYQNRLSYELNIIDEMGFCNYFLVVYDFIKYSKKNGILVGPGRGSAAGSLVSFSLGITDIDPIKYDLLFERFLNPERKTMPDIDTDFPDDKRDDVIKYVTKKYGHKNVAGIITFSTLSLKQVIRDVSRTLSIPIYKVDDITKLIPAFTKDTIDTFYKENEIFRTKIDSDKNLTKMLKIAKRIEGFPKHTSVHAAGIIMSEIPLDEVIPLTYNGDDTYISSYTANYLEELGLLKMDFLGLKNLSLISNILNDIENNYQIKIDFSKIPLDDKDAISLFATADTTGIFQFESSGMKQFLKRLKPENIEDIFAAIALFRPGAAVNIDSYIKRRHHEEEITYLDDSLKEITKNTYGILIYQEQIMQVARIFAGYTLGEADILRRAMSKKKLSLLKAEETKFIEKSLKMHHTREQALKIFNLILNFAGYGFNRSHSVAYSIIAYKMAYLKVYYKSEFFANLLTNVIGSDNKTREYIEEAKSKDIIIEKPNINLSSDKYIVNGKKIIYPFSNLKSIGLVASKSILKARKKEFSDIYEAFSELIINGITKKVLECLINSDSFSLFGYNKKTLIHNLDSLINYGELTKDLDPSLVMKPEIERVSDYSEEEMLEIEKNTFGFYFSHHPTTKYYKDNPDTIRINEVKNYFSKEISTLILVDKVKIIITKKGDKMAFIDGNDETGNESYTAFPLIYKKYPDVKVGDILKIKGRVERRYNNYQIVITEIERLN